MSTMPGISVTAELSPLPSHKDHSNCFFFFSFQSCKKLSVVNILSRVSPLPMRKTNMMWSLQYASRYCRPMQKKAEVITDPIHTTNETKPADKNGKINYIFWTGDMTLRGPVLLLFHIQYSMAVGKQFIGAFRHLLDAWSCCCHEL